MSSEGGSGNILSSLHYTWLTPGLLWCPNLSVPDPSLILPLTVGLSFAATIFVSNNKMQQQVKSYLGLFEH